MKLVEFVKPEDAAIGYYDPAADKVNQRQRDNTRKVELTLRDLNRLKKMRAQRRLESLKRQDLLGIMYGIPEEGEGGGGMGAF